MTILPLSDACYIAGFVDGEGCITVSIKPMKAKNGNQCTSFAPSISITNTNRAILDWICKTTGLGTVLTKPRREGWKQCFQLTYRVPEIPKFLELVGPFLKVKSEQARLMTEFYELKGQSGDKNVSLDTLKRRVKVASDINELNRRGV